MEDVFIDQDDRTHSELEVGSRDWSRHVLEIQRAGEREGIFAAQKDLFQCNFESGINFGFNLAYELGVLKGRLLVKSKFVKLSEYSLIKNSINLINEAVDDLVASDCSSSFSVKLQAFQSRKQKLIDEALLLLN